MNVDLNAFVYVTFIFGNKRLKSACSIVGNYDQYVRSSPDRHDGFRRWACKRQKKTKLLFYNVYK